MTHTECAEHAAMKSVHAFVFSWPGWEENARRIACNLLGCVDRLTVIYKTEDANLEHGAGQWVRIPDDWYYGMQCRKSMELFSCDVMVHVQADAECEDWPRLISRCRHAFRDHPQVGIWSPDVFHTSHTPDRTGIWPIDHDLLAVTNTDGVVWAISKDIVAWMKTLDYSCNNMGWLISEAAAAHAFTNNRLVLLDLGVKVTHPKGSGYDRNVARKQSEVFLKQLSSTEIVQIKWMSATKRMRNSPASLLRRFVGRVSDNPDRWMAVGAVSRSRPRLFERSEQVR